MFYIYWIWFYYNQGIFTQGTGNYHENIHIINYLQKEQENISSKFSNNSEAFASEICTPITGKNLEEMFPLYYIHNDMLSMSKHSTTHWWNNMKNSTISSLLHIWSLSTIILLQWKDFEYEVGCKLVLISSYSSILVQKVFH